MSQMQSIMFCLQQHKHLYNFSRYNLEYFVYLHEILSLQGQKLHNFVH